MSEAPVLNDTQKRLYDGFASCVNDLHLPLNKITVTQVTKCANLNRRTFYSHFIDIYDMFDKLKGVLAQVLEVGTEGFVTPAGITKPDRILKSIDYISCFGNYILAVSILDTNFFPKQISELVQQKLLDFVKNRPDKKEVVNDRKTDYHITFISYGLGWEAFTWMTEKDRIPAADLANIIYFQLSSVTMGMVEPERLEKLVDSVNLYEAK